MPSVVTSYYLTVVVGLGVNRTGEHLDWYRPTGRDAGISRDHERRSEKK